MEESALTLKSEFFWLETIDLDSSVRESSELTEVKDEVLLLFDHC